MWEHVELREIRVFLMLCEELHFGRTAERLRISQTRVSQTIQELEAKLGAPLFERTSRRVGLTEKGARVREELAPIYGQLTDVLRRARAASEVIPVRLGLFCDPAVSQILRIVKAFERVFPGSVVDAVEVPVDDPFGPLHRDEFDLTWKSGVLGGPELPLAAKRKSAARLPGRPQLVQPRSANASPSVSASVSAQ
jgi:DNA-binding transcriptional LysR family regulator